jgi:hypothetical protein
MDKICSDLFYPIEMLDRRILRRQYWSQENQDVADIPIVKW